MTDSRWKNLALEVIGCFVSWPLACTALLWRPGCR